MAPLVYEHNEKENTYLLESRAVIAAIANITTESALVWESMQVLEKLSGSIKVTLAWIPGHYGTLGNEEPDKLT